MSQTETLTETGGRARVQRSGAPFEKVSWRKQTLNLALETAYIPGPQLECLRAGPVDPLPSCNFITFVCVIIQSVTISPHKTLCSARTENRLDFPRLGIGARTRCYSRFTVRKQYVRAPATSVSIFGCMREYLSEW